MIKDQSVFGNLALVAGIKDTKDRTAALRALIKANSGIEELLKAIFHPDVEFFKFDRSIADELYGSTGHGSDSPTYRAIRQLFYLVPKASPNLSDVKRITILRNMLESIREEDRAIFVSGIFDRTLPFRNLGRKFIADAIPEMFQ